MQQCGGKKRVSFEDVAVASTTPLPAGSSGSCGSPATPTTTSTATNNATTLVTPPGVRPSREKVAAVLRLSNPVQLQRHLLRSLLDNQVRYYFCYLHYYLDDYFHHSGQLLVKM